MKKFTIMGLTFFALTLAAGCGKEKECPEGQEMKDGKCVDKAESAGHAHEDEAKKEGVEAVYTITNKIASAVKVTSGDATSELAAATAADTATTPQTPAADGGCVKVKESQFANLVVQVGDTKLCDSTDMKADGTKNPDNDCKATNYEVTATTGADGAAATNALTSAAKNAAAGCVDLAAPAAAAGT